jgi:long-chain fatty acid transport protein
MTKALAALTVVGFAVSTVFAADGFLMDHTARASGVAGAYLAQVDDPTAVFYNPGALGLLKKKKGIAISAGGTSYRPFQFQGRSPGAGAGTIGEQSTSTDLLPAGFATLPFGKKAVLGLCAFTSMRMRSEWESPDAFSGRFLATQSTIEAYDAVTTVGYQFAPAFGIGAGAVYRTAKVSLDRHLAANFAGTTHDIALQAIETDTKSTLGWSAGMLFRPSPAFSFGATYRSPMTMDFEGAGKLTQIAIGDAQIDQLVTAAFPFGQNLGIVSQLRTPAQFNAGIAFKAGEPLLFEIDVNRAQWRPVDAIVFTFPNNSSLDVAYPLNLKNTTSYRAGMRFQFPTGPIVRFGYSIDKSPQPDETVSPFLAMLDRNTATVGFGLDWLDIAVGYSTLAKRSITTSTSAFNGDYSGNRWTVVVTATK